MKKNKNEARRLSLSRETLSNLDSQSLAGIGGGATAGAACCQESRIVCSIQHTCFSCPYTDTCA